MFLFSFAFVSCDDDDDVVLDTINLTITITSPAANDMISAGTDFQLLADITDNEGLEEVRAFVAGADGTRIASFDEEVRDFLNDNRNYDLEIDYTLPANAATGSYTITVEAEAGNVDMQTVMITVNEADLNAAAFNTFFASTEWFETWDADDDNMLDEDEFGGSFFDTWDMDDDNDIDETEWNDFAADFGLEGADFATWDADSNGVLSMDEINTGLGTGGWFDTWALDNDGFLDEEEYTGGIFIFWDDNDDDILTFDEYVDRFNMYYVV